MDQSSPGQANGWKVIVKILQETCSWIERKEITIRLLLNEGYGHKVLCMPILQLRCSWIHPIFKCSFFIGITHGADFMTSNAERWLSSTSTPHFLLSFASEAQTNLSALKGKSTICPQISQFPSSIATRASLTETIFDVALTALDSSKEHLVAAIIGGTTSKAWHGVSMNSPSISTYLKELRWLTINSSSPQTVTILPLTGYLSFWWRVEVTAPVLWIHGRPNRQE